MRTDFYPELRRLLIALQGLIKGTDFQDGRAGYLNDAVELLTLVYVNDRDWADQIHMDWRNDGDLDELLPDARVEED